MRQFQPKYPKGATPLNPDELAGLIPDFITTHGELNALEQKNILDAVKWAKNYKGNVLTVSFVFELHQKMFDQVWKWAGQRRTSDKSIGVPWTEVLNQLANLVANTQYRIDHEPAHHLDQIATEFHHRLVEIHIFPNGNGRHARLLTDLLLERNGQPAFSWGKNSAQDELHVEGGLRDRYILALREGDRKNYAPLLDFVRS